MINIRNSREYNSKILVFVMAVLIVMGSIFIINSEKNLYAADKDIVVVIDPGHGGTQPGAEYNGRKEKELTMIVAQQMADELSKYEGVKVYLTHDSAEDTMSIKQRSNLAKKVKADYFFCIHFNASGRHNFYGAETWVGSIGRYYSEMYAFSDILLNSFTEIGLFNRGIRTRLGDDGLDYYGVIRNGAEDNIPAVIIEHCHMDVDTDNEFIDNEEDLIRFGNLDAQAAAKFLKLKRKDTGEDYSDFVLNIPPEPTERIQDDDTNPVCELTFVGMDDETQKATFRIEASDDNFPIMYYGYSLNGGISFSPLQLWDQEKDSMEFTLDYSQCISKSLKVQVYNGYNLDGISNEVSIAEIKKRYKELKANDKENIVDAEEMTDDVVEAFANEPDKIYVSNESGGEIYLIIAGVCVAVAIMMAIAYFIVMHKLKKRQM